MAKFFRVAKLCESAGYGFDKMLQWKKQTGNEIFFETTIDKTKFTFMLDTTAKRIENEKSGMIIDEGGMKSAKSTERSTENNETGIEKSTEKNESSIEKPRKSTEKTIRKISKNTEKILDLMAENPFITTAQLAENVEISVAAINKQIAKLKKLKLLRRESADKGGKWIVIKQD